MTKNELESLLDEIKAQIADMKRANKEIEASCEKCYNEPIKKYWMGRAESYYVDAISLEEIIMKYEQ